MTARSIPSIIPVLALPPLLLFPRTQASIRVPRHFYARMLDHSFSDDGFLGTVLRETHPSREGAVLPIGCVAKVFHVHHLACGRAVHVHLHGLARFRVKQERIEEECGEAEIDPFEDEVGCLSPQRKRSLRDAIHHPVLIRDVLPETDIPAELDDEPFVNRLCVESKLSFADKYLLLEADTLDQRCGRLLDLFRFRLATIRTYRGACPKDS
ncbi:MAG: LON peptidase substrate-binding domain-containing protein [Nitrospirae bacterium]|nr:LON peptidase substrate-binding domain-containing protein [Nitrospirota bacterium]